MKKRADEFKGHTPGPWAVVPHWHSGRNVCCCRSWPNEQIAVEVGSDWLTENHEADVATSKTNARLIAAAPDLLAAHDRLVDECERLRKLLIEYGYHKDNCAVIVMRTARPVACDCGWKKLAALLAGRAKGETRANAALAAARDAGEGTT